MQCSGEFFQREKGGILFLLEVLLRGMDQALEKDRRTEHVGIHHKQIAVEMLPSGPEGKNRPFPVAGVLHQCKPDVGNFSGFAGDILLPVAGHKDDLLNSDGAEPIQREMEEHPASDRKEAFGKRVSAHPLAYTRGKDDRFHSMVRSPFRQETA